MLNFLEKNHENEEKFARPQDRDMTLVSYPGHEKPFNIYEEIHMKKVNSLSEIIHSNHT